MSIPTLVTQNEAEAGTSTDRTGWTAQRVRQGADAAINRRVIRVDHTPPAPTADNENAIILVTSTGDSFVQRTETIHGTAALATWENYPITSTYIGAFGNPPGVIANGRYYNYGLRIWFQAVLYGGEYRWSSGGEPIGWRGYAYSENIAAANNIDGVNDLVYIANLYRIRRVLTFTPGSNSTIQRTWENQREDEFQGTATTANIFYDPGEISVVVTNSISRAYICLVAGDYNSTTIPTSSNWLRVSPLVRTPVETDDTPADFLKEFTIPQFSQWIDSGFDFDAEAQAAITLEFSINTCNIEFNRSFHPDQFSVLQDISVAPMNQLGHGVDTIAISWAGSAPNSSQGTDCRVWVGKNSGNNILFAFRPSVISGDNVQNLASARMWRIE